MTNRVYLTPPPEEEDVSCAFCGQSEHLVPHMFIGVENKGICTTCVGYVREDMGLSDKTPLDKMVEDFSNDIA